MKIVFAPLRFISVMNAAAGLYSATSTTACGAALAIVAAAALASTELPGTAPETSTANLRCANAAVTACKPACPYASS